MEARARRRPGPVRWLLYAFGRGLPAEHREWVLHDLTTRTWPARQLVRSVVQVLPFALVLAAVLPGELWVRVIAVIGGALVGMIYAVAYLYETTEHRAIKAGYPRGTLQHIRDAAHAEERARAQARYNERYRREQLPPGTE
ncbi:DUF5313 family protein [Pseudonocardia humida]|uniref:DUF5313 family protein n=1 Tax=Pseudonocardia humida TaxID=2800819 RepID=A0ABT0ZXH1_9PSEU|nr:DUF5313 family protein [Pseudonocardia humida]MCO1655406.1 DUF5313 family protein [Pseudonocardia humida]